MSIKNILVAYNGTKSSECALNVAILMAKKYDAHLTGVLTHGLPNILYSYGGHFPQIAMKQMEDADREHRAEVRKNFETATIDLPSDKMHYLDVFGEADAKLMEVARTYDIVVMGNPEKDSDYQHMVVHPDVVARNSGRPVLVVPDGYRIEALDERAVLAWDGRRAAARALSDAMQILESKTEVAVLTIGHADDFERKLKPIMEHLDRHEIPAHPVLKARGRDSVAQVILDVVEEEKAGILVMGAYEHAKLAEDLFGGVTNTIVNRSPVPVLLSH